MKLNLKKLKLKIRKSQIIKSSLNIIKNNKFEDNNYTTVRSFNIIKC